MLRVDRVLPCLLLLSSLVACGDDDDHDRDKDGAVAGQCSVSKTDDGDALIRCDDGSEVTIKAGSDGDQGEPGDPGERGPKGDQGDKGADGTGCSVSEEDGVAVVSCPDGTMVELDPIPGPMGEPGLDARSAGSGFRLELVEASIDDDRHPVVTVKLTDAAGVGLDRMGQITEGAIAPRFTVAFLRGDGAGFNAYILSSVTSPITNDTTDQPSSESDGEWTLLDAVAGTYSYRFSTALPEDYSTTKTHRIAAWATRTVGEVRYAWDDAIDFRPDGDSDVTSRQITTTETCNNCHNPLALHGEQRLSVELCATCHTPQGVDPDTGNSIDLRVMVHKIHMGHSLPSVEDGTPYQIIGFRQSVHDYSHVGFPHEVNHCPTCHTGSEGERWAENPSIEACGACHDDVDFSLPTPDPDTNDFLIPHPGGPRENGSCTTCHAVGGLPGVSVQESHERGKLNPNTPELSVEITNVVNTAPGDTPTITFRVLVDGAGRDLTTNPLDSLRFVLAGPSTGITGQKSYTPDQSMLTPGGSAGVFQYTLPDTLAAAAGLLDPTPSMAEGSFGIMAEGRHTFPGVMRPDGTTENVRVGFANPVRYFAVTDTEVVERRQVVSTEKCNTCHREMAFHGDNRSVVEACVFCHNANQDTLGRMPTPPMMTTVDATSVRFGPMIHRIHGSAIAEQPFFLYSPSSTLDFSELEFPGAPQDCETCHLEGTYDLPLPDLPPTVTRIKDDQGMAAGIADMLGATAANCTGCHDAPSVRAHAELMTTEPNEDAGVPAVESCATCHAAGSAFGVDVVHARPEWEN